MKAMLWVAAALVIVVLIVVVVGWTLPVAHVASASARVAKPPAEVHALVADVAAYPSWWADMTRVEMLPPVGGRSRFRQYMGADAVLVEIVESTPPARFVTRIADPDQPFGGTWTIDIAPDASGSRVTVTENGEVYNPIFRVVSRFVLGHTSTIDSFLKALQSRQP